MNKTLYTLSKRMLEHRTGTLFEDMYWLNPDTAEVNTDLYVAYVQKFKLEGMNEFDAQWRGLELIEF